MAPKSPIEALGQMRRASATELLVQELLDAHADTIELLQRRDRAALPGEEDVLVRLHVDYLQALLRCGKALLATSPGAGPRGA